MTTFLAFLSTAADFALTLSLKAAIVAAGFIPHAGAHAPTRRRIALAGKGDTGASHIRGTHRRSISFGRKQPK